VYEWLTTVDTLAAPGVEKGVGGGTAVTHRQQLLQYATQRSSGWGLSNNISSSIMVHGRFYTGGNCP